MGGLSFDTVSKKLNALLESVDPEKTTTKDIFRHLTDELGSEVKHHKQGIRVRLFTYLSIARGHRRILSYVGGDWQVL